MVRVYSGFNICQIKLFSPYDRHINTYKNSRKLELTADLAVSDYTKFIICSI